MLLFRVPRNSRSTVCSLSTDACDDVDGSRSRALALVASLMLLAAWGAFTNAFASLRHSDFAFQRGFERLQQGIGFTEGIGTGETAETNLIVELRQAREWHSGRVRM